MHMFGKLIKQWLKIDGDELEDKELKIITSEINEMLIFYDNTTQYMKDLSLSMDYPSLTNGLRIDGRIP